MMRSQIAEKLHDIEMTARKAAQIVPIEVTAESFCAHHEEMALRPLLVHIRELCAEVIDGKVRGGEQR